MLAFRERRGVSLGIAACVLVDRLGIFDARSVVIKSAYGQALGKMQGAAHVVPVVVGDKHRVNVIEFREFCSGGDTACVAAGVLIRVGCVEAGETNVDQKRLAGRRDEQRRLAALGIDEIDAQCFCRPRTSLRTPEVTEEKRSKCVSCRAC